MFLLLEEMWKMDRKCAFG